MIIDDVDLNDDIFEDEQIDYENYGTAIFKVATLISDII
jgi:hypothetical protein